MMPACGASPSLTPTSLWGGTTVPLPMETIT